MRKLFLALLLLLSSCYLDRFPLTPRVVTDSTFLAQIPTDAGVLSGTAWAVDDWHLVTAGHMCEFNHGEVIVITNRTQNFRAKPIVWTQSQTNGHSDLCVLESPVKLRNPLLIANYMPHVGDRVGMVGYPMGSYSSTEGYYLGDLDGKDSSLNDDIETAACDHGASGSAVYTNNGVWGVVVRIRTDPAGIAHDGTDGCATVPLKDLKEILDLAGVDYTNAPQPLEVRSNEME